jgi:hypothetical protein
MKKKVGEEAARHWIKGMRSIASNIPISPFHLAAADDMESLLDEVLVHRKTKKAKPQETIAKWIKANTEHRQWYICPKCSYQAPRFKDEWVGLTDEEARELCVANVPYVIDMVRALEAKLKEKNNG